MTDPRSFSTWGERHRELASALSTVSGVARGGEAADVDANVLAHALLDMDELCRRATTEVFPRLLGGSRSPQELSDALVDLGELLRELLYHIRDAHYFRYLTAGDEGSE